MAEVLENSLSSFKNAVDAVNGHYNKLILHYGTGGHYAVSPSDIKALDRAIDIVEGMVKTGVSAESPEEAIIVKKMYSSVAVIRRAVVISNVTRSDIWNFAEDNARKEDIRRNLVSDNTYQAYKSSVGALSEEVAPEDGRDDMPALDFDSGEVG